MEKIEYAKMRAPYLQAYNPYASWRKALEITKETLEEIYAKYPDRNVTLRYLYYRLVKRQILGLVKSKYDGFIKALTKARKDIRNKEWHVFQQLVDDTRDKRQENFYRNEFEEVEDAIRGAFTIYHHLDPWGDQPLVEVWVEKSTIFQMYYPIAKEYRLTMQCLRGNIIFNVMTSAFHRMVESFKAGRRVIILYLGDFNPAGDKRPQNILTSLHDLGLKNVEVYKVLVNKDQIAEYDLVPSIDAMDLDKAFNDPLRGWFLKKHGKLYDVDVESMEIADVDRLLRDAIEQFLDASILETIEDDEVEEIPVEIEQVANNTWLIKVEENED